MTLTAETEPIKTFELKVGEEFALPGDLHTQRTRKPELGDPVLTRVVPLRRGSGNTKGLLCKFAKPSGANHRLRGIALFLPEGALPGARVRIEWTCAHPRRSAKVVLV